jgi:F-type H+-transporting ATPase subunit delta
MAIVNKQALTSYVRSLTTIGRDNLEEILLQLKLLYDSIALKEAFASYFYSKNVTYKAKRQLLDQLLDGLNFHQALIVILQLMVENKDLDLLQALVEALETKLLSDKNITQVTMVTVAEMTKKNQKDFKALAKQIFNSEVVIKHKLDKSLVGGVLLENDDFMLDLSFKKKIQILQETFFSS